MSAPISDDGTHSEQNKDIPELFRAAADACCRAILHYFGINGG